MKWIVMLLGCLTVPLLALGVVLIFYGPRYLVGIWQTMRMVTAGLGGKVPSRINLEPADDKSWLHRTLVQSRCRELQEAGFQPVGTWTVQEMPGMALAGLVDPQRSVYAAVYDMPVVGVWVDLFCLHQDGSGLTVTNATMGWEIDSQPDREKGGRAKAPVTELLELMDNHPAAGARIALDPAEFASLFESEYAREQDWRLARGGITVDEVRRMAQESGPVPSEEELQKVTQSINEQNITEIARACLANYLDDQGLRGGAREAMEPRLIAVHERLTREQAMALFAALVGETARQLEDEPVYEALEADWESLGARDVFRRLAEALPHPSFPRLQGRVEAPIAADVYLMPAEAPPSPG